MQLMPATAEDYGVRDAFDPEANLQAGARHLRKLLDRYDGDLALTLAAYNAGEGAVARYDGVPNYPETKNYVRKVHEKLGRTPPPGLGAKRPSKPVGYRILEDGTILISNDD
jgi:soluble lytic murein transglycosylase-like protein